LTIIVELPQVSALMAETKDEAMKTEGHGLGIETERNHDHQEALPAEAIIHEQSSESESSKYSQVSRTMMEKADEEREKKMEILSVKAKLNKKARRKRAKLQKRRSLHNGENKRLQSFGQGGTREAEEISG